MKKISLFILTSISFACYAQLSKMKVPSKVAAIPMVSNTKNSFEKYSNMMGKDISEVLTLGAIKDTIGATSRGFAPQAKKGVQYLILKTLTGERLGFDKNRLAWVAPN